MSVILEASTGNYTWWSTILSALFVCAAHHPIHNGLELTCIPVIKQLQ